ncbi:MAG: hypothetical protein ABR968_10990 [Bacteroidales bacterium]|jgi:hypothetical protein
MKTRNVLKLMAILIAVVGINIAGCKKDKTSTTPDPSSLQQLSKDDAQVQASDDEITGDANAELSSTSAKAMDTTISSCNITVDTVGGDSLQITLQYHGFNLGGNFKRTGTVVITKLLGVQWKTAGCAVVFKYENLIVEKISSGKTFTFNGTRTWTNVSGGLIKNLNGSTTVTHTITGAMTITFDDGSTRIWNISRQRVWGGTFPSALTVTVSGFGSAAGYNNLVEYGTNRKGEAFYTQINTPILYVYNSCLAFQWIPIWGVIEYQIPSVPKSATLTFGYNSSDALVPYGNCADYFRLDWVVKTNNGTDYFQIP